MSTPKSYLLNLYPNLALTQLAKLWAEADEDFEVEAGKFSSKHHRLKAAASALEAAAIVLEVAATALAAADSASAALFSENNAATSETNASASASAANADAQTAIDTLNLILQNAARNYKLVLVNC